VRRGLFWGTSSLGLGFTQAARHFNRFRTSLYPLERDQDPKQVGLTLPLVLTSAITLAFRYQVTLAAGHCQLVPSRSMAQQRTNSLLPTATIAIFLRDFFPPLMR
jgi:hypothetical protein